MGDEVSIVGLGKLIGKEVRIVIREELDRNEKQVAQAILKILLADMGLKNIPHEKRVTTAIQKEGEETEVKQ